MLKTWIFDEIFWIEKEDDGIHFYRVQRPTWVLQQCQVTTRQKTAKCWKDHGMCGEHAAVINPLDYPKAKGHPTGGRHGLNKTSINLLQTPLIES